MFCSRMWICEANGVLRMIWKSDTFKIAKEKSKALKAYAAFQTDSFFHQTCLMFGITRACHDFRVWGAGCPCHQQERKEGKIVKCDRAGRNLQYLFGRRQEFLDHTESQINNGPGEDDMCRGLVLPFQFRQARIDLWRMLRSKGEHMKEFV